MSPIRIGIYVSFLLASVTLMAQSNNSEKITDKWPYLYAEFHEGTLYFDGNKVSKGAFNVDVSNQSLVYYETDQIIKSVNSAVTIDSLLIGNTKFLKSDAIYEVLAQSGSKALLKKVRIDLNSVNDTGGGYGTGSSTNATTKVVTVDVVNYTGVPYEVVKLEMGKGKVFETIISYYLTSNLKNAELLRATKNSFSDVFPDADVKGIVKAEKTRFNSADDLIKLFNMSK